MEISKLYQDINKHSIIQIIGPMECKLEQANKNIATIYLDGGVRHRAKIQARTEYIIGDGDSLAETTDPKHAPIVFHHKLPTEKNISDLGHLLEHIEGQKNIIMYGFEGGRLDHQLFVIGEVHQFIMRSGSHVRLDQNFIWPARNLPNSNFEYELEYDGLFSVGSLEQTVIDIFGDCQYQVKKFKLETLSSRGLSNNARGKVGFKSSGPFWIYLA